MIFKVANYVLTLLVVGRHVTPWHGQMLLWNVCLHASIAHLFSLKGQCIMQRETWLLSNSHHNKIALFNGNPPALFYWKHTCLRATSSCTPNIFIKYWCAIHAQMCPNLRRSDSIQQSHPNANKILHKGTHRGGSLGELMHLWFVKWEFSQNGWNERQATIRLYMTRKENNQSMLLWSIQPRLCFVYGLICLPGKVALKKHVDEYAHFTYSYQTNCWPFKTPIQVMQQVGTLKSCIKNTMVNAGVILPVPWMAM